MRVDVPEAMRTGEYCILGLAAFCCRGLNVVSRNFPIADEPEVDGDKPVYRS
jgi:hypothetical protein